VKYYPILRGKQYELLALKELASEVAAKGAVIPVLEPTKSRGLDSALTTLMDSTTKFGLIVNPKVGEFSGNPKRLDNEELSEILDEYDNWVPMAYVDKFTTKGDLLDFVSRYEFLDKGVVVSAAIEGDILEIVKREAKTALFLVDAVPSAVVEQIAVAERVKVRDVFKRQVRNADYPEEELFSEDHIAEHLTPTFTGYGDFSIVGTRYSEEGGAALAVALHHIYIKGADALASPQYVAHFVSDSNDSTANVGGKFLEALTKLVNVVPKLGPHARTKTFDQYEELFKSRHFPGLGYAKKLALTHHLRLMNEIL